MLRLKKNEMCHKEMKKYKPGECLIENAAIRDYM
jgi:hypothetical protein